MTRDLLSAEAAVFFLLDSFILMRKSKLQAACNIHNQTTSQTKTGPMITTFACEILSTLEGLSSDRYREYKTKHNYAILQKAIVGLHLLYQLHEVHTKFDTV